MLDRVCGMTAALAEGDRSVEIHRRGCQDGSWPKRVWEVSRVLNGRPLWHSRERTAEEMQRLRAWLNAAMPGPPGELAKRLIETAETPRVETDLTRRVEKPPTGIVGSIFTYNRNPNGRPRNPSAFTETCNVFDVGQIELATGQLTRHGMRLIVADLAAQHGIEPTARQLNLSRALVRELEWEFHDPLPPLPRRHRPRQYTAKPLETEAEKTAPILTRARRLWHRGLSDGQIARRIGISHAQLKQLRIPRHAAGPCRECASYFRKQPTPLHLSHCPHYGVTFRLNGEQVKRVLLDASQYLAELRRVEPKATQPALPAFNREWSRVNVARWLGSRMDGRSTLEGHFGNVMTAPSGHESFVADFRQAWKGS